ncbi:MAG: M1 family metallopeptidase, partial [Anaerolineaceae bacterium]
MRMTVDMETGSLKALTQIEAIANQSLRAFSLDFTGLEWDAVRVNGVDAQFERRIRKLVITPAKPLEKDSLFTVEVEYHGTPWTVTSVSGGTVGWFRAMDGTINIFTEPDGAYSWFPCNNHPRDKALYRFEITVDDPWVAAANGLLIETIPLDNQTRYVFELNEPMATYLATVHIDKFDLVTMMGPNDIQIRNYIPADFPEEKREVLQLIPVIIEFYTGIFGPYPSTVYGVLVMDVNATRCATSPFGDETQSLTILCPAVVREVTFVHELAHEWFGDSVSIENWQDLWVKEGMAQYAGCLWEARNGVATDLNNCMIEEAKDYPNRWPVDEPPPNHLFCSEAYTGGALVYYSLHLEVGDEVFFE